MKSDFSTSWSRLAAAARRAPSAGAGLAGAERADVSAPFGFSARVAAKARLGAAPSDGALFERLAARALGIACACALAMAAWGSLSNNAEAKSYEAGVELYDPVGEVITFTQT